MNRRRTLIAATAVLGGLWLGGCQVPGLGPVTPAPVPKTAAESPLISARCRTDLGAVTLDGRPVGTEALNAADLALGADATGTFGPTQTGTDLAGLATTALAYGVTTCP